MFVIFYVSGVLLYLLLYLGGPVEDISAGVGSEDASLVRSGLRRFFLTILAAIFWPLVLVGLVAIGAIMALFEIAAYIYKMIRIASKKP